MRKWTIQVADLGQTGDGPGVVAASDLVATLEAHFAQTAPGSCVLRGVAGTIDDERVKTLDAVLLVVDQPDVATPINQFAAELEEQAVAVMIVPTPDVAAELAPRLTDVAYVSSGAEPLRLLSMLDGLLQRQGEVKRLARELAVARRYNGGLSGEMERINEELQLAATMQRELLPATMPDRLGVRMQALWRPAAYVSGDIYAVHALDEDRIGILLADCVGHGVPAALMTMSLSRSFAIHALAGREARAPHEVLARLNHDMTQRKTSSSRFATAVYAVIDCRRREMEIAAAGHPPSLLYDPEGNEVEIEGDGPLLGVFKEADFGSRKVDLPAGSTLVLYSDGFEQAFVDADAGVRRGDSAGYKRVFSQLGALGDPARMIEHVEHKLDAASGSLHQADDVTMVCIHAAPLGTSIEPTGVHAADRDADLASSGRS